MFGLDFALLIKRVLPTSKRALWNIDWSLSILKGVNVLYDDFIIYRTDTLRELSYSSQTLIFEKLLNDNCDNTLRRIYIDNTFDNKIKAELFDKIELETPIFLNDVSEGKPPFHLFDKLEFEEGSDFIVFVPTELTNKVPVIRALVEKYKLSSTQYTIQFF